MRTANPVPTVEDVAERAGVSTATVSRCLNTPDVVSPTTRTRVMAAVEALGYTPNFGARAMAAKRTFTIGAIIPTIDNAIFARGIQAFQEALHEKGYTLLVASSAYSPAREAEQIRSLVARGADGLLLIGYERSDEIYDYLAARSVPVLVAWAFDATRTRPAVGFDNRASMRRLADEVLAMGHRHIGYISGLVEGNDRAAERLAGLRDGLAASGLDPAALPVVETPYQIENGAAAFEALMARHPRPTAVMCGNDVLAVGAVQRALDLGLLVPDDVSVTGFDDIELASIVRPPLATVHVPHREMGRQAAQELVRMVEAPGAGRASEVHSALRLRGSLRAI